MTVSGKEESSAGELQHHEAKTYSGSDDLFLWQRVVASSLGGILTSLLTTPMDVVKIRLQAQAKPLAKGDCYIFSCGLSDHLCVHCRGGALPLSRLNVMPSKLYTSSWVRCNSYRTIHYHSRPSLSASRQCIYPQPCNSAVSSVGKRMECFTIPISSPTSKAFYTGSLVGLSRCLNFMIIIHARYWCQDS